MLQLVFNRLVASYKFPAVEISESLEAIQGRTAAAEDGTVFVAPWRERAKPPGTVTGGHRQLVDMMFVTALLIREHDDPRGATRALRFDQLKADIEGLMAGWQPEAGGFTVAMVGAEASGLGNGVSILAHTWQVSRFLTGVQ